MKFEKNVELDGTSLMGYVTTSYSRLCDVFGDPCRRNGDKIKVEWSLRFEDGTRASVYDWKEDEIPMGNYQWHIGGDRRSAVDRVQECLAA